MGPRHCADLIPFPQPSLDVSPRGRALFFCTLHKPDTSSSICSQVMTLLPFSMPETTQRAIPHSTPTTYPRLSSSRYLFSSCHRYGLALIYSQPLASALFPISESLLKNICPAKSTHPLWHFSHSLLYHSRHIQKVLKKQEGEAENHRCLLINLETHKTHMRTNGLQTSCAYSPCPEILVIIQGPAPVGSLPHTFHPKVSAGHFWSTLITLLTCCSSSTTQRYVCLPPILRF